MHDRPRGTLIGLAMGDALGAAVAFQSPDKFEPVVCFRSGVPHGMEPGERTDDTSMALALAKPRSCTAIDIFPVGTRCVAGRMNGNGSSPDSGTLMLFDKSE